MKVISKIATAMMVAIILVGAGNSILKGRRLVFLEQHYQRLRATVGDFEIVDESKINLMLVPPNNKSPLSARWKILTPNNTTFALAFVRYGDKHEVVFAQYYSIGKIGALAVSVGLYEDSPNTASVKLVSDNQLMSSVSWQKSYWFPNAENKQLVIPNAGQTNEYEVTDCTCLCQIVDLAQEGQVTHAAFLVPVDVPFDFRTIDAKLLTTLKIKPGESVYIKDFTRN